MDILERRKQSVLTGLQRFDRVLVAVSGGVDSAVVLALACEALGPQRVLAVTGSSSSLAESELEDARRLCRQLGVAHEVLHTEELARPGYRANAGDRCYHCRAELFRGLCSLAKRRGYDVVVYGAIKEDDESERPGMRAAREWRIEAPLAEAGLDKAGVRELAARAGLSVGTKPADACLASRVPVGTPVTVERLGAIERAERAIKALGFDLLRVRHHGEIARLELDLDGLERLLRDSDLRLRVVRAARGAGFRFVTVDLEGYRSGGGLNPTDARVLRNTDP